MGLLDSNTFGEKIYNTFPEQYRVDDLGVNYALKRYIESLSEGGFSLAIDETSGITELIDPEKVPIEYLPILFKHYGLDIINGVPEIFQRKLLPTVSTLYKLKGTVTSVEFLTSLVSGVTSKIEVDSDFNHNHAIDVKLEMDYENKTDVPDRDVLLRIINQFVPFFCDVTLVYSYLFSDKFRIYMQDSFSYDTIYDTTKNTIKLRAVEELISKTKEKSTEVIPLVGKESLNDKVKLVKDFENKLLKALEETKDIRKDTPLQDPTSLKANDTKEVINVKTTNQEPSKLSTVDSNSVLCDTSSLIGSTMILNNLSSYDIIRSNGTETIKLS